MEFDKNTLASEEDRRLAEAKKLTLEPLHADTAPEAEPDSEVAARHINEGALANAPNDTEQDGSAVQPSKELLQTPPVAPAHKSKLFLYIGSAMAIIGLGMLIYVIPLLVQRLSF